MTHGLNHVNIRTDRALMDTLRDFYRDVIGLREGYRPAFPAFGYWLYAEGVDNKAAVHLIEMSPDENRRTDVATTLDHFAFDCTDQGAVEETLKRHNIAYQVAVIPQLGQTQFFLLDPAGNKVELNFASSDASPAA